MARTADRKSDSRHTADGGQQRSPEEQREPEGAAVVVLTPRGQRRLAARAAWLASEPIPRFAHYYLDDPDLKGWASAEYGHDVSELALLTRILQRAITTDQLPPENPGIVELGDEVAVEFVPAEGDSCLLRFAHGGWTEANAAVRSKFGDWRVLLDRFAALAHSDA